MDKSEAVSRTKAPAPDSLLRVKLGLMVASACIVVIAIYGTIACTAASELGSRTASEDYYNRLVDGFAKGRLSLALDPPPGLDALPNPYDPEANVRFRGSMYSPGRVHDLSYYKGRLYLYFSVVPALVLFLPFHLLTGGYVSHQQACFIFCSLGFLASVALVSSVRRVCFPETGWPALALGTLCVGLIPVVPIVLQRPDVWEVPLTASYGFWMLSLLGVWACLNRPAQAWVPALCASAAAGLAIGCRPNSFLGAAMLLVPLFRAIRPFRGPDRGKGWRVGAALIVPPALIGAGLLAYNHARFGSMLEFGQRYQLNGDTVASNKHFSPDFAWFNFRLYFLEYPGWGGHFPFVKGLVPPPIPAGHGGVDFPVGAIPMLPFVLCAAAVPLGFHGLAAGRRKPLAAIIAAILAVFASNAVLLCLFFGTCLRYQLEFLPALVLLAAVGLLALESHLPERRLPRFGLRAAVCAAAAASIAFNLLMTANLRAHTDVIRGGITMQSGRPDEAEHRFRDALRLRPYDLDIRLDLVAVLYEQGKLAEALAGTERALAVSPESAPAHYLRGCVLYRMGSVEEAVAECQTALRLQPGFLPASSALRQMHRG